MRRGFLLDARANLSADSGRAARRRAKQRERLTSIAWERVRQMRPTSGTTVLLWASSNGDRLNDVFTNGDLLKLMCVSRSVSSALEKVEARAFDEYEAMLEGTELEENMWKWWMADVNVNESEANESFPYQGPLTTVDRVRRICWGDFHQENKKGKETSRKPTPQGQRVKITLKKTSGEIWVETEPLPVLLTLSYIVFDVTRVDRHDSVVPYLIYDEKVQPYWKSLVEFPSVRKGCQAMDITVVLQPKETPIAVLFSIVKPLNEDRTDMSYETFKTSLTDPKDARYMDMERLMNTVYPVEKVKEIWDWDCRCDYATLHDRKRRRLTTCTNLYPVEAYPGSDKGLAR